MGRPKKSSVCKTCNRGPTNKKTLKTSGTQTELKLDELDKIISFFLSASDRACRQAQETIHDVKEPILETRSDDIEVGIQFDQSSVRSSGQKDDRDLESSDSRMENDSNDGINSWQNMDSNETKERLEGSVIKEEEEDDDSEFIDDITEEWKDEKQDESATKLTLSTPKTEKIEMSPSSEVRKSSRLAEKYPSGKSFANPTRKRKVPPQKKNVVALKKRHLASLRLKPKTEAHAHAKRFPRSRTLNCLLCSLTCKTLRELTKHKEEEHGGRVHKCEECGKAFRNVQRLSIHLRCHTGEKPYSCSECSKCFPDPSNLNKHIQSIHQHPHRCDDCRSRFATETELLVHQENSCRMKTDSVGRKIFPQIPKPEKKDVKKVKCDVCGREVLNLRTHMLTHSNERPFSCEECHALFKSIHDLKKHKLRHRSDQQHLCDQCGKSFKHIFAIKAHMKTHEAPVVTEVHPCKECNMGFANVEQLAAHTECHMKNIPFKCLLCDNEYETPPELKAHVLTHPAARIPVNCNYCDKLYPTLPKMQVHRHTHVSFHMCSYCSKSYSKTSELKRHEATHTGIFNHRCERCNKGFVRPDQLKKHMMVHTGDRRFKCETCERSYITDDTLKTHIKLVHGPKTFVCNICGKSFAVEKRLQFHVARHLGKKDYKCDVCGKAFADPSDLPQHKRIHKQVKNFPCLLCPKAFYAQRHLDTHFRVNHKNRMQKITHACEICGKVFPREWKLKRHRSVHENKGSRIHYLNKPNVPTVIKIEPVEEPDLTDLANSTCMLEGMDKAELAQTVLVQCSVCGASCETNELNVNDNFVCGLCSQIDVTSDDKTSVFTFTGQEIFKCNMCQKTFALLDNFLNHLQEHPELEIKIETLPTEVDS